MSGGPNNQQLPTGGASLSDLLTAAKNVATAINQAAQNYLNVQGAQNRSALAAATVIKTSAGRLCTVIVTTAGSATGAIYDAISVTATSPIIYVIPNTVGVYVVNCPTSFGLVVAPGTGQVVTVSWS